ncbi:MAG TPA: glycosyltransferase [Chryseolinea sp.]|nr:glycosyltransferase [Chryseolinea sp.]
MEKPLVSVICLCYNHRRFVREAVVSVLNQSYKNIQVIVADDASTDDSIDEIHRLKAQYSSIELLLLPKNLGNCRAFNEALKLARGEFIIDFATDDLMMQNRIENQVAFLDSMDPTVGLVYTDAIYISEDGKFIRNHFDYLFRKGLISRIPQGDVYRDILTTYFIPGPTMMIRREVFAALNGYDESLSYEDFDFWVRSSRIYRYAFLNERLTSIRKLKTSMSTGWYVPGDRQLHSTYLICKKAQQLNRNKDDERALITRVRYEFRQSVLSGNHTEALLFFDLLKELNGVRLAESTLKLLGATKIPLNTLRKLYHWIRYS